MDSPNVSRETSLMSCISPLSFYPNSYHGNNQTITDVELTVKVTVVEGKCQGDHHNVGDSWTIESVTPQGMCLGAWGAVYPYVMALDLDGGFSWEEDPSRIKISCPDPIGIKLLVERIEKK